MSLPLSGYANGVGYRCGMVGARPRSPLNHCQPRSSLSRAQAGAAIDAGCSFGSLATTVTHAAFCPPNFGIIFPANPQRAANKPPRPPPLVRRPSSLQTPAASAIATMQAGRLAPAVGQPLTPAAGPSCAQHLNLAAPAQCAQLATCSMGRRPLLAAGRLPSSQQVSERSTAPPARPAPA